MTMAHSREEVPPANDSLLSTTIPFPLLDRTVSLLPGTRPLMMGNTDPLNCMVALISTSGGRSVSANQTTQT